MRHVDELELEFTEADAVAGLHGSKLDLLVEPRLTKLVLGEPHRQRRTKDRDFSDPLQLRNDVRQPTDMVLMAVGNGDAPEVRETVLHVPDVGDDEIDSPLPLFGELATRVD